MPWSNAVAEDGTFKPIDQLRELYGAKGVDGDDEVVAYCRIGERSSHTWFVLHELLGYRNVRNYDGSWTEYGSLVGVPIETGDGVVELTDALRDRALVGPAPEGMPDPASSRPSSRAAATRSPRCASSISSRACAATRRSSCATW